MTGVVARDIAESVYAVGELGWAFRQVKWLDRPPVYEEESDYWILVERDGAPEGIVYVDTFMGWESNHEPLASHIVPIRSTELISWTTPFPEVLRLFASRPHLRYYLLDGGRVTHWLEDWHLSGTAARLALLAPCLELDAALEKLILLAPDTYLDGARRQRLQQHIGNWGYSSAGYDAGRARTLIRCAGLIDKWLLIKEHRQTVAEAIDFMGAEAASKAMFSIAKFRDGLVHGHAVLPIRPFARGTEPVPDERFRREAADLVGLLKVATQLTDSIQRFVRARPPRWLGGEFHALGSTPDA